MFRPNGCNFEDDLELKPGRNMVSGGPLDNDNKGRAGFFR